MNGKHETTRVTESLNGVQNRDTDYTIYVLKYKTFTNTNAEKEPEIEGQAQTI